MDEIRRECLEAPFATIESEARASAIEFCYQSRAWTEKRLVEVEAGEQQVRLRPSQEGRVEQVLAATLVSGTCPRPLRMVVDRKHMTDRTGEPVYYSEGRRGPNPVMNLWPVPDKPVELELFVALVPQRQSRSIPDHISEVWHDAIVCGALARLLMQSNKPWTDPQKSTYYREKFAAAVREARHKTAFDNWTPRSVKYQQWV